MPRRVSGEAGQLRTSAKLVLASLGAIALAACGNATSSSVPGTGSGSQTATAAQATAAGGPLSPASSVAASMRTPATIQAVGSEIIRYWIQHQGGIGDYSLLQNSVVTVGAKCVTLFSNRALATFVKSQATQDLAAPNEPNAETTACATGNFAAGDITVVDLGSSQLSASPGPNDMLYIDDTMENGTWHLIARQGTPQSAHSIHLTQAQVAEAVNSAFVFATAHIPSGS
jgi:hypothetical protein